MTVRSDVVMDEAHYAELVEGYRQAYVARVKASLADHEAGRVRRFATAAELLAAIDEAGDGGTDTTADVRHRRLAGVPAPVAAVLRAASRSA